MMVVLKRKSFYWIVAMDAYFEDEEVLDDKKVK